jgi:hypothetical protein
MSPDIANFAKVARVRNIVIALWRQRAATGRFNANQRKVGGGSLCS